MTSRSKMMARNSGSDALLDSSEAHHEPHSFNTMKMAVAAVDRMLRVASDVAGVEDNLPILVFVSLSDWTAWAFYSVLTAGLHAPEGRAASIALRDWPECWQ